MLRNEMHYGVSGLGPLLVFFTEHYLNTKSVGFNMCSVQVTTTTTKHMAFGNNLELLNFWLCCRQD